MRVEIIDDNSPFLQDIQILGDNNRSTLGFLPAQAFVDYARKNQIIALINDGVLCAYTMFRHKGTALVIVHLCVVPSCRKKGYARQLIDALLDIEKDNISNLQLACRRDFGLDKFWRNLNFFPIAEKDGRALKQKTRLTIWTRPNPHCQDLFTMTKSNQEKLIAVVDTNIVIDLTNKVEGETEYLFDDYIDNYAQYCITPDVLVEIDKNTNELVREKSRGFAVNYFEILQFDASLQKTVMDEILAIKPADKDSNTWFDISHISCAIAAGANAFLTRDETWLNNSICNIIKDRFGLSILSPGEFIRQIDELDSPESYSPQKLYGLNMSLSEMKAEEYPTVINQLYPQFRKKSDLESEMRRIMSQPQASHTNHIYIVKMGSEIAAVVGTESNENELRIPVLLINGQLLKNTLSTTLVKWLAFKILEIAQKTGKTMIAFPKENIPEKVKTIFLQCNYMSDEKTIFRPVACCITPKKELEGIILNNDYIKNETRIIHDNHVIWTAKAELAIEKMFWPLKITPSVVPCYIVPIMAEYAQELFDNELSVSNPSLFNNEKIIPALSPENVYFKRKMRSIQKYPAHILWYVSRSKKLMGTGMIRACSILDAVEVADCKSLYHKYQRLGVIDWEKMKAFGNPSDSITAYAFSYTELFEFPVPLDQVREIISLPNETFQSFREINFEDYLQLYKRGTKGRIE